MLSMTGRPSSGPPIFTCPPDLSFNYFFIQFAGINNCFLSTIFLTSVYVCIPTLAAWTEFPLTAVPLIRARILILKSNKDPPRGHQESPCGRACALFRALVLLTGPQAPPGSWLTQARCQQFIWDATSSWYTSAQEEIRTWWEKCGVTEFTITRDSGCQTPHRNTHCITGEMP